MVISVLKWFLCIRRWLVARDILFFLEPKVMVHLCTKSLWTEYITNCLWEFHRIYNLASDYILRSKGGQSHSENKSTPAEATDRWFAIDRHRVCAVFISDNYLEPLSNEFNYVNCHVQACTLSDDNQEALVICICGVFFTNTCQGGHIDWLPVVSAGEHYNCKLVMLVSY